MWHFSTVERNGDYIMSDMCSVVGDEVACQAWLDDDNDDSDERMLMQNFFLQSKVKKVIGALLIQ